MVANVKTSSHAKTESLRFSIAKPKLSLFGDSSYGTPTRAAVPAEPSWPVDDKEQARAYVESRLSEQEQALEQTMKAIMSLRTLLMARLEGGNKMAFLVAFTQVRNAEARRDLLIGMVGSLEYLQSVVEEAKERFEWKQQCDLILERKPLYVSIKDTNHLSFHELKDQVRCYCQQLECQTISPCA